MTYTLRVTTLGGLLTSVTTHETRMQALQQARTELHNIRQDDHGGVTTRCLNTLRAGKRSRREGFYLSIDEDNQPDAIKQSVRRSTAEYPYVNVEPGDMAQGEKTIPESDEFLSVARRYRIAELDMNEAQRNLENAISSHSEAEREFNDARTYLTNMLPEGT